MWLLIEPGGRGGGEGYFLVTDLWGCAAGWGRIFMTGLTITGLYFRRVTRMLEWGCTFSGFWGSENSGM